MPMDISELSRLYLDEKLSTRQIGNQLGVNHANVLYHLKKFNIPRRTRFDGMKLAWQKDAENKGLQSTLSEEEKKLLAISIEFEGSIGVAKQTKSKRPRYRAGIQLGNTRLELLYYIQNIAKAGTVATGTTYRQPNHKIRHLWFTHNLFLVKKLLEDIQPYLITKKAQATLVIDFCNIRLENYHMPPGPREEEIFQKLKILNQRGLING